MKSMKLKVNNDGARGSSALEIARPALGGGAEAGECGGRWEASQIRSTDGGDKKEIRNPKSEIRNPCGGGIYAAIATLARVAQGMTLAPPAGLLAAWFAVGALFVTKVAYSGAGKLRERYSEDRIGAVRK